VDVGVRVVTEGDAAVLVELLRANRNFLAPWEPVREDEFFTPERQRRDIAQALAGYEHGASVPCVILRSGEIVGRVTISDIVRGAFQSAHLGYWVGRAHNGQGVATAAVAAMLGLAFDELGLHRLQADTLVHNTGSQRVLARNGFTRIGLAPRYLQIAGRWQDHVLHQRLNEPVAPA
jgi:ribosomal-protein-alanine N-acetyltransferase